MALKIVFMGTPDFALPILKSIHKSEHRILKVYTQNPKKKDRGQKISLTPVHEYSNLHQIEVSCPKTLDTEKEYDAIKKINPTCSEFISKGDFMIFELEPKDLFNYQITNKPFSIKMVYRVF